MNVYILLRHWAYEGDTIEGVYATLELAHAAKRDEREQWDGYDIVVWTVEGSA